MKRERETEAKKGSKPPQGQTTSRRLQGWTKEAMFGPSDFFLKKIWFPSHSNPRVPWRRCKGGDEDLRWINLSPGFPDVSILIIIITTWQRRLLITSMALPCVIIGGENASAFHVEALANPQSEIKDSCTYGSIIWPTTVNNKVSTFHAFNWELFRCLIGKKITTKSEQHWIKWPKLVTF